MTLHTLTAPQSRRTAQRKRYLTWGTHVSISVHSSEVTLDIRFQSCHKKKIIFRKYVTVYYPKIILIEFLNNLPQFYRFLVRFKSYFSM